jgi:chitin disaccharide deacetylase
VVPAARLLITADDYGYSPAYNRGILRAARSGAIDAAGAMVGRPWCDPAPILRSGVEVGLHLELAAGSTTAVAAQVARFEDLFGVPPVFLDGHHHCHASAPTATAVAEVAVQLGVRVRSVDVAHRELLRRHGILTAERLLGRLEPGEPAMPPEVAAVRDGGPPPEGLSEWMVHPGERDRAAGSSYDETRDEDLHLLLRLADEEPLRRWRAA